MTTILENSCRSIYQYSEEQYNVLQQFDRSNKNELRENECFVDHCTFQLSTDVFVLIIHGSEEGKVQFNNKLINISEIEAYIREEQGLSLNHDIVIKLICCHDGYMGSYLSDHCWIISSFYTTDSVAYDFFETSDGYYSQFIDKAKIRELSPSFEVKKSLIGLL